MIFSTPLTLFFTFACVTLTVNAHTHIRNVVLDGKALDREQCIYPYLSNFNFPAEDNTGDSVLCRTKSMSATVEACGIAAGSVITFNFKEEEGTDGRAIENEHNGPITAYMAPIESEGQGKVWFKIFEQGYDMETDMWAINILNENDGLIDITIPSDIKAGDYILRGEILALHLADQGIFEVYSNCVHLTVSGGGDVVPEGIDLKEMYGDTEGNPGLLWDLYDGEKKEYPIPGPKVYQPGSGSSGTNNNTPSNKESAKNTSKDQTEEVEEDKTEEVEEDKTEEVEEDVTEEVEEDVQTSKKSEKTQNRGKNRNSSSIEDQSETEDNNKPTDTSSSDDPESSTTSFSSIKLNNKLQRPPCNNVRKRRIK